MVGREGFEIDRVYVRTHSNPSSKWADTRDPRSMPVKYTLANNKILSIKLPPRVCPLVRVKFGQIVREGILFPLQNVLHASAEVDP